MSPKLMSLLAVSILLLAVPGCDDKPSDQPDLGTVTGVVKVLGVPTGNLSVLFIPEEGRSSSGTTNDLGEYKLIYVRDVEGAKIGKHKVQITTLDPLSGKRDDKSPPFQEPIPAAYNTATKLTADVKAGPNTFDFEVKEVN